jgi:hypothetical protein
VPHGTAAAAHRRPPRADAPTTPMPAGELTRLLAPTARQAQALAGTGVTTA